MSVLCTILPTAMRGAGPAGASELRILCLHCPPRTVQTALNGCRTPSIRHARHTYIFTIYNSIFQDKRIIDAHTLRSVEKEQAAGLRSCRRRILVISPATFFTVCRAYITVRTVPDQDEPWQHGAAYSSRPSWRPVYRNGFRRLSAAVRTGESARSQESPPQAPPEALPRSAADAHRLTIISRLGPDMIIKRSDREPLLHWGREAAPYTRTEHHEW